MDTYGPAPADAAGDVDPEPARVSQARKMLAEAKLRGDYAAARRAAADLAEAWEELEDASGASKAYQEVGVADLWLQEESNLNSEDAEAKSMAWWRVGAGLASFRDSTGAVSAYRQSIAAGGRTPMTLVATFDLAQLLEQAFGDTEGAREAYEEVLELLAWLPADAGLPEQPSILRRVVAQRLRDLGGAGPGEQSD